MTQPVRGVYHDVLYNFTHRNWLSGHVSIVVFWLLLCHGGEPQARTAEQLLVDGATPEEDFVQGIVEIRLREAIRLVALQTELRRSTHEFLDEGGADLLR